MDTNPAINPEVNQNPSAPIQSFQSTPTNSNPSDKKSKFNLKWILILLVVFGIIIAAGTGGYFLASNQNENTSPIPTPTPSASTDNQVMCTQDAMECPDGSFVSRQGPTCEFAVCPGESTTSSTDTTDWKTYTNQGFSVNYPSNWKLDSELPTDTIFQFNYPPVEMPRVALFRNFAGDWCGGMPTTTSKIKLSDGTTAEKWDCKQTIVLKFTTDNEDYIIFADGISNSTYATANEVINSVKFDN